MIKSALALLLIAAPVAAQADSPQSAETVAPSLDWMVGNWSGNGKLLGRNSRVTLSVRPVAGTAAYSFDYQAVTAAERDQPEVTFFAHAFFQRGKGNKWHGRWVDNFGNLHDISALLNRDVMISTWGSPSTEIGRSSYAFVEGRMRITDSVMGKDGVLSEFAQSDLGRE